METVLIIGGGIAGTTCAEYISACGDGKIKVVIITANDVIKTAVTTRKITKMVDELQVKPIDIASFENQFQNVTVVIGNVKEIHVAEKYVKLWDSRIIHYDKICICTGAKPKVIVAENPYVVYIRDTDTVKDLQERLNSAKKIVVVGNGGIALELVYEIENCEVLWCVRTDYIGNKFFDEGASAFLLAKLKEGKQEGFTDKKSDQKIFSRRVYEVEKEFLKGESSNAIGCALGPDWSKRQKLRGSLQTPCNNCNVTTKFNCEPKRIFSGKKNGDSDNVYIELNTGEIIGADFIVSAAGAVPNFPIKLLGTSELKLSKDGGICVDENMRTSVADIYAAGDVCSVMWEHATHWFPMKLWTQGWQMGAFAGKCIVENIKGDDLSLDFCFELFTHATTFFGYKVCLLGCYNAQKIENEKYELLLRHTPGNEYIKLVMLNGRIQGAMLIGDTDLEETFENLILNQIDVDFLKDSLLDPNVDIEDYFD